ncbi:MAG: hypothetical protein R6V10_01985 [bacterium]
MNKQKRRDYLEYEVERFSVNYGHDYEDVRSALARSYKFYKDVGYTEEEAWDKGLDLLGSAHVEARMMGFTLRCMIDHMLFSIFHRSQSLAMQKKA